MTHALSRLSATLRGFSRIAVGLATALISVVVVVITPDSVGATPGPVSTGHYVAAPEA